MEIISTPNYCTKGAPRRTAASQKGTGHAGKTAMAVGRI